MSGIIAVVRIGNSDSDVCDTRGLMKSTRLMTAYYHNLHSLVATVIFRNATIVRKFDHQVFEVEGLVSISTSIVSNLQLQLREQEWVGRLLPIQRRIGKLI